MKSKKYLVVLCVLGFVFNACEKETKLFIPKQDSQLVISSLISSHDESFTVEVSLSAPLYVPFDEIASDSIQRSQVIISDGINEQVINLLFFTLDISKRQSIARFESKRIFPVQEGKTYYLQVISPNGKIAKASCTIPVAKQITKPVITLTKVQNNNELRDGFLFEWEADLGYYFILPPFVSIETVKKDTISSRIYSSKLVDGEQAYFQVLTTEKTQKIFFWQYNPQEFYKNEFLHYAIISIDENYFLYQSSLEKQNNYKTQAPFAEPISIYSNIEGGSGIFAGYATIYEQ